MSLPDAGAIFNPMTGPLDTTRIEQVRIGVWLNTTEVSVKRAVQFSNDGVAWDAAIAVGSSFASTAGWVVPTLRPRQPEQRRVVRRDGSTP